MLLIDRLRDARRDVAVDLADKLEHLAHARRAGAGRSRSSSTDPGARPDARVAESRKSRLSDARAFGFLSLRAEEIDLNLCLIAGFAGSEIWLGAGFSPASVWRMPSPDSACARRHDVPRVIAHGDAVRTCGRVSCSIPASPAGLALAFSQASQISSVVVRPPGKLVQVRPTFRQPVIVTTRRCGI